MYYAIRCIIKYCKRLIINKIIFYIVGTYPDLSVFITYIQPFWEVNIPH